MSRSTSQKECCTFSTYVRAHGLRTYVRASCVFVECCPHALYACRESVRISPTSNIDKQQKWIASLRLTEVELIIF